VSSVIPPVTAALSFPASSLHVKLMELTPSTSGIAQLHPVLPSHATTSTPLHRTDVPASFVPVSVCDEAFVGDVTASSAGGAGGTLSRTIVAPARPLEFPEESRDQTSKLLAPSARETVTDQVVSPLTGMTSTPFTTIELPASLAPVMTCATAVVGLVTASMTGVEGGSISSWSMAPYRSAPAYWYT